MKISVYVTSYNQQEFLSEAINSVLSQTMTPFEIIIVDDCSTDGSQYLINSYVSKYPLLIKPIFHTQNEGIAQTRIDALKAVTGDYVTYVDGDDRLFPNKLENEVRALQSNPGAQITFSNYFYIDAEGKQTGIWATEDNKPPEGNVFIQVFAREFPRKNLFRNEIVNFNAWKRIGFHDPNLMIYEDYEMRIRLTKSLATCYCNSPLSEYRQHASGLSQSNAKSHLLALEYLYKKNRYLLDDLDAVERETTEKKLNQWLAIIAKKAAEQALQSEIQNSQNLWRQREGIRYYLRSLKYNPASIDFTFLTKLILPYTIYSSFLSRMTVKQNKAN